MVSRKERFSVTDTYLTLNTIDAIKHIKEFFGIRSMYELAKSLSDDTINIQATQILNYLKGKQMSRKTADRIFEVYGIVISDVHENTGTTWDQLNKEDDLSG